MELNYKDAYYYLFNQITNVTKWLKFIQGNAETICIDEMPSKIPDIDIADTLSHIIEDIENKQQTQKDENI